MIQFLKTQDNVFLVQFTQQISVRTDADQLLIGCWYPLQASGHLISEGPFRTTTERQTNIFRGFRSIQTRSGITSITSIQTRSIQTRSIQTRSIQTLPYDRRSVQTLAYDRRSIRTRSLLTRIIPTLAYDRRSMQTRSIHTRFGARSSRRPNDATLFTRDLA